MRIRPRFSLKFMLLAVAIVAAGSYWLALPTLRAERFMRYIREHDWTRANGMLPEAVRTSNPVSIFDEGLPNIHQQTFAQLFRGRRTVVVGNCWRNGSVEYIITPTTIELGESLICW